MREEKPASADPALIKCKLWPSLPPDGMATEITPVDDMRKQFADEVMEVIQKELKVLLSRPRSEATDEQISALIASVAKCANWDLRLSRPPLDGFRKEPS